MNIIESLKGYITDDFLSHASTRLDESPGNISSALSASFPSILSGILNKSSDSSTASSFLESAKSQADNGYALLRNPGELFSGVSRVGGSLMDKGKQFISSIFDDKTLDVANEVGKTSGVKPASAMSLMAMSAPMVMGFLGHKAKTENWNTNTFSGFLIGQKDNIAKATPASIGSILGSPQQTGRLYDFNDAVRQEPQKSSKRWLKYIVYAVLGMVLFFILQKSCVKKPAEKFNPPVVDTIGKAKQIPQTGVSALPNDATKLGSFNKRQLPSSYYLLIPQFGVENKLIDFIDDRSKPVNKNTWFGFDRLTFEKSSAKLTGTSNEQLKNIADIMIAYPKVRMDIAAYTDEAGNANANQKLSTDRANTVKNELVKLRVDERRLNAEGLGANRPAGDTTANDPLNSQVLINVTNK